MSQAGIVSKIATVGGGTLVSRVLAFLRDAWIAAALGAGPYAEAFFATLQVVNFFRRLLADGALNGAFVPIWLALRDDDRGQGQGQGLGQAAADRFTRRSLLTMFCLSGIGALILVVTLPWLVHVIAPGFDDMRTALTVRLMIVAAPYVVLAGLVAVIAAALNAEGRVAAVTVSTVMFNAVMVAAVAIAYATGIVEAAFVLLMAAAIVVAGLFQLVVTAVTWGMTGRRFRTSRTHGTDQTHVLFRRAGPGLIAAGIPQLKLIAAAAIVSSSPAAVSWLYYANRLYELPLGVASIAIAALLVPRLAAALNAGDAASASEQSRALELALGLALPAAAGFAVLAHPIAVGLFQRGAFDANDSIAVAAALTAICAGLPGHTLEKLFGAVSYAHEDTRTPMLAALCGLGVAIAGGLLLFPRYGYVGAAAAIALSGWVGATLLGLILYLRGWLRFDGAVAYRVPGILLATAIMAGIVHYVLRLLEQSNGLPQGMGGRLVVLGVLVVLGLAVYAAALLALRVTSWRALYRR